MKHEYTGGESSIPAEEKINWDEVTLEPMDSPVERNENIFEYEHPISEAESTAEFTPVETEARSPEVIQQEEEQVAELHQSIHETLKAAEPVKVEVAAPQSVSMEQIDLDTPDVEINGQALFNKYEFEKDAIKEASGGLIEYVPSSKQSKYGYEFEGGGKISPEKLGELNAKLETAEHTKSQEAFDYVQVPDKAWGAEWTKNLQLNDGEGYSSALNAKKMHNAGVRKKIWLSSVAGAATAFVGGLGTAVAGGAGTATAALGIGIMGIGGGAILGVGALGWGAKKIYDSYKEKKAAKNFVTASIAQNVRGSLRNTQ